jgi:hypothetical protein
MKVLIFLLKPFGYNSGLKHAACGPHVARQVHLCGPLKHPIKGSNLAYF